MDACARTGCNEPESRVNGYCSVHCEDMADLEAVLARVTELVEKGADMGTTTAHAPACRFCKHWTKKKAMEKYWGDRIAECRQIGEGIGAPGALVYATDWDMCCKYFECRETASIVDCDMRGGK